MPEITALYPGTFDCLTYGHLNLIERCAKRFTKLVVAVAANMQKSPVFTVEERMDMLREAVDHLPNVEIAEIEGLTTKFAESRDIQFVIRGLRAVTDFEYELQMALMNQRLAPDVETIFMAPTIGYVFISSSMTKEILANGGDISSMVPPHVEKRLRKKYAMNGKK
ncbi:MAG: pantetheine-phosphate adenylyltransferase [Candidatus Sumerlaeia bacterium]